MSHFPGLEQVAPNILTRISGRGVTQMGTPGDSPFFQVFQVPRCLALGLPDGSKLLRFLSAGDRHQGQPLLQGLEGLRFAGAWDGDHAAGTVLVRLGPADMQFQVLDLERHQLRAAGRAGEACEQTSPVAGPLDRTRDELEDLANHIRGDRILTLGFYPEFRRIPAMTHRTASF